MTLFTLSQKIFKVITAACILFAAGGNGLAQSPVTFTVQPPVWQGSRAAVPITITLRKGWKLYGMPKKEDSLRFPPQFKTEGIDNVGSIKATWPPTTACRDYGQKGSVYYDTVTVVVEIALKESKPTTIQLPLRCLVCAHACMPITETITFSLEPPAAMANTLLPFLKILILGFLGGMLLNIMPCVLPVLGIKLKGLAHVSPDTFRTTCLYTTMGIMTSFWLLGLFVLSMKYFFQYEVGWGMQFQNPYFVAAMCVLMVTLALSLLGAFHFQTPAWVEKALPQSDTHTASAFFSGVFAVLLATPCSAPMLGVALGFALTGSAFVVMAVFTCIAVGFSFPYWVGMLWPGIGRYLPKPGRWSVYVERGMGVLFLGTAVWLMTTALAPFLSPRIQMLAWVLLCMGALIPLLGILHSNLYWRMSALISGVALGSVFCLLPLFSVSSQEHTVSMTDGKIQWHPWSKAAMTEAINGGRVVFVDITASWCSNCWVNKQRVLMRPEMQKILTAPDIICLRGDFSRGSEEILQFLKEHKRAGIPFNMLVSKKHPLGIVFSEWLSVDEIIKAVHFMRRGPALAPSLDKTPSDVSRKQAMRVPEIRADR